MRPFTEAVSSGLLTDGDTPFIDRFKLDIKLGNLNMGSIPTDLEDRAFAMLISSLTRPSRGQIRRGDFPDLQHSPLLPVSNLNQPRGWIFNSRNIAEANDVLSAYDLKIAKKSSPFEGSQTIFPKPLFGGSVYCRKNGEPIKASLDMNAARYLHFNHLTRSVCRDDRGASCVGSRIGYYSSDDSYGRRGDEYCYAEGANNWFTDRYSPAWLTMRRALKRYIQNVEGAIIQEFERASDAADPLDGQSLLVVQTSMEKKYDLQSCEVAWEFSSESPLQLVDELVAVANNYKLAASRSDEYPILVGREDNEEDGVSRSVKIELERGCTLAIYPKTNKRVRVEVRYRLKQATPTGIRGKTADSYSGLAAKFDALKRDAEGKVNDFLSFMNASRHIVVSPSSASVVRLIQDVGVACRGDEKVAEDILYLLSVDGCINLPRGSSSVMRSALMRMKKYAPKILHRSSQYVPYRPTEKYQWAVQQLRQNNLWRSLITAPEVSRRRRMSVS